MVSDLQLRLLPFGAALKNPDLRLYLTVSTSYLDAFCRFSRSLLLRRSLLPFGFPLFPPSGRGGGKRCW